MTRMVFEDTLRGYIRSPLSMPGQYERKAAKRVSKQSPKLSIPFFIPCWNTEFFLVLQMIKSAHWTITMDTKKAVWQVYSRIFRSLLIRFALETSLFMF